MIDPMRVETVAVPVFITQEARQIASRFARQQPNAAKAEQVRLNTLAICAVNNYLKILGIPADPSNCDSWNPLLQITTNVADLDVRQRGRIECRPILPSERDAGVDCYVPAEVLCDRIAYVVVQIDPEQPEAWILGFVDQVEDEALPLSHLHPMSELPAHLEQYHPHPQADPSTQLKPWLQGQLAAGWRSLEDILSMEDLLSVFSPSFTRAPSFRSTATTSALASVMADLAQQGLQIPPETRGAYQTLRLGENPLRLYALTWTTVVQDQTPAWGLLIVLEGEPGVPIPTGIRLQIRDIDHLLVDQILQSESPHPYLYGAAGNTQAEPLWVTIALGGKTITLPSFTVESSTQP